jgi:hypothetical protein
MTDDVSNSALIEARRQMAAAGGNARAESMTSERRSAIAKKAAKARWKKPKKTPSR